MTYIGGATSTSLAIDPGVQFVMRENSGFAFGTAGPTGAAVSTFTVQANGTAGSPIRFLAEGGAVGVWRGLEFAHESGQQGYLRHVVIDGGGCLRISGACNDDRRGALVIGGSPEGRAGEDGRMYNPRVQLQNVTVTRSVGAGLRIGLGGGLAAGSTGLTVSNQVGDAILVTDPDAVGTIPASTTFSGTGRQRILIEPELVKPVAPALGRVYDRAGITTSATWPLFVGVPYVVRSAPLLIWGGPVPPVLTLSAGVEVRFGAGQYIGVGMTTGFGGLVEANGSGQGSLRANGVSSAPVILTADTTATLNGFWGGIVFDDAVLPQSLLSYTHVRYAAGTGFGATSAAAIRVRKDVRGQFITNSQVVGSGACGIARIAAGGSAFTTNFTLAANNNSFTGNTVSQCSF
jgi:hypothetical protein